MNPVSRSPSPLADTACPAPLWSWRSVLAAGTLTLATFLLLPYLEMFSEPPGRLNLVAGIDSIRVPSPPPPLPQPPPPPPETARRNLPKPRLTPPQRLIPLQAALNLNLALGLGGAGDFSLDFPLDSAALLGEIDSLVLELADLDEPPQPLVQMHPVYPHRAQARRLEGVVSLEFVVTPDGATRDVRLVSAHPEGVFDRAATAAVLSWRFRPGRKDGRAVAVRVRQTIRFKLDN